MKITAQCLSIVSILWLSLGACKSSSTDDSGAKRFPTCASANLACASNGACPGGQAFANGAVVMTCDGTDNGDECCAPCPAPNVVQDNVCLFPGVIACANLGGYCADTQEDASPSSGAKCDPSSVTLGTAGMCGDGKNVPLADCCSDVGSGADAGDGGDDDGSAADTGADAAPPSDAQSG